MEREELHKMESSQRQHNENMLYHEKLWNEGELQAVKIFKALDLKLVRDENEWCVLYGDNLQEGIAGFDRKPLQAILNWYENFKNKEL